MLGENAIETFAVALSGCVSQNDHTGWLPFGAAIVTLMCEPARYACPWKYSGIVTGTNSPAGIGCTSDASIVGIGSSAVGSCANMLFEVVASLRSLARIQPFWTNVSLPSGRTSLTVACRSTSGVDDLTQRLTAPAPIAVVSLAERRRHVGDGGAGRRLRPVPFPLRRGAPQPARPGVGPVVGQRRGGRIRGVGVDPSAAAGSSPSAAFRPEVPGAGGRARDREFRERLFEAGVGVAGHRGVARAAIPRRCRTAPGPTGGR